MKIFLVYLLIGVGFLFSVAASFLVDSLKKSAVTIQVGEPMFIVPPEKRSFIAQPGKPTVWRM